MVDNNSYSFQVLKSPTHCILQSHTSQFDITVYLVNCHSKLQWYIPITFTLIGYVYNNIYINGITFMQTKSKV